LLCFVPGLSQGGWSWDRVTPLLRERGHTVVAITQTGLGECSPLLSKDIGVSTFVDDVVNTLIWRDLRDVVLVGHRFCGIAITGAADCVPERTGKLIYLDAAVVESSETGWIFCPTT
jgi:pimeloyl-ACP methyl ester carboxylesterase